MSEPIYLNLGNLFHNHTYKFSLSHSLTLKQFPTLSQLLISPFLFLNRREEGLYYDIVWMSLKLTIFKKIVDFIKEPNSNSG